MKTLGMSYGLMGTLLKTFWGSKMSSHYQNLELLKRASTSWNLCTAIILNIFVPWKLTGGGIN
eukprot:4700926-Ditylum_brightwellii.AAC.1